MDLAGAVAFGVAAALAFAVAALLQQQAARSQPAALSLRPSLLVALLHQPTWLAGIGALVGGYGFQAFALALGPVALVQPLITAELVFAVPIATVVRHGRPGWREWVGVAAVTGGVSLFLITASPAAGTSTAGMEMWSLVVGTGCAAIAVGLGVARIGGARRRAMSLAAAAGVAFGLLAVLTKATVALLGEGLGTALTSWQTYAVVLVGIFGLLLSQSAYQAGPLTFSMPVVAVVEPTVAVVIGSTVLDEQVRIGGSALGLELLGASVAAFGVVMLATSKVVLSIYAAERPARTSEAPVPPEGTEEHPRGALAAGSRVAGT